MSVESPPQVSALPPTWVIGSRRARLLTSSAALRSPQTCFRLPHCLGRFAPCGFSRPPALRLADYRLPPVIELPLWFFLFIVVVVRMLRMDFNQKGGGCAVVLLLFVFLYYISRQRSVFLLYVVLVLLGLLRLLMIPAFGEILRQWCAKVGASPPLSSTHYGLQRPCSARVTMRSAAVEKPPYGRHFHLAGVIMLLDVGGAATEEQGQKE